MDEYVTRENITRTDFQAGALLLVDKPEGWTSFDVVNKIRGTLRQVFNLPKNKVGHAGTLDPMATGLLLICTGKWTKKLGEFQGLDKEYTGIMTLGATTVSYDKETPEENPEPFAHLTTADIQNAIQKFTGEIEQKPPMYSAIKVEGKPLYKSARKGEEIEVESRRVTIHEFEITAVELPHVHFRVVSGKGTYIRSLAHDLGQMLGCGAYLSALRRTRIGMYRVADAWSIEELVDSLMEE